MNATLSRRWRFIPFVLSLMIAGSAMAEPNTTDWPQFRGHHRDGISPATGLLDAWPQAGPKEVWRREIGEGYSAISVIGGRLFTMYSAMVDGGAADGEDPQWVEVAAAFDGADGSEIWRTEIGAKLDTQFGNGPRTTPTVVDGRVYVMGSYGDLAALDAANGKKIWQVALKDEFGSGQPSWGFSSSPVVVGDLVIVESGGEGKSYVGLAADSGEVRWTSGDEAGPGYNSALPLTLHGQEQFVYIAGTSIRSIDRGGREVWRRDWPEGETHAMPVFVPPDKIYASGVADIGATLIRVMGEDGEFATEEVWKSPSMRNHFSTSVHHQGTIYGFDNATLKAISAQTGELAWAKRGLGKGSLIVAAGHLVVLSDRGKLLLLEATPESYNEKGSVQALEGRCWTAPVLADGRIYLRNHEEMVTYDLKK